MFEKIADLKAGLSEAVQSLKPTQSFNIVFYQDTKVLKLDSRTIPANPENKRKAEAWLGGIVTAGTTDPVPAMTFALQSKPKLIYFIADHVETPALSELQRICKRFDADHRTKIDTMLLVEIQGEEDANQDLEDLMRSISGDTGGVFKCAKVGQP